MFKLNLKIALRNLWRNKVSSFINVIGLAIGLAACLMLLLYVTYEWNFDKQFKGADHVYQVMANFKDDTGRITSTNGAPPNAIANAIKNQISGIESVSRIGGDETLISNNHSGFKKVCLFVDPDVLGVFNYEFIAGHPKNALNQPNSVIVTATTAKLLFGTTDVLNKTIKYNNTADLKITGIIKDQPTNSSYLFDLMVPWSFYESISPWAKDQGWGNFSWLAMVRVSKNADVELINAQLKKQFKANNKNVESFLFPFAQKHLHGKFVNGKSEGGDIERIYLFVALALGILLIACINFMNLATAKSERRAKEVGIKKTIGASKSSLIGQFMIEAMLLAFISMLVAVVIIEITLPIFNNLLAIKIKIDYHNINYLIGMLLVVFLTGLLSGSYPAFYLSSFNPIQNFKIKPASSKLIPISLRQVLVVCQFCFAITLVIGTLVIYKQIQFIKNKPIGYDVNLLAQIPQEGELNNKFELFKNQLLKTGAVTSVNQTSGSFSDVNNWSDGYKWPGMSKADLLIVFNRMETAYDFVKTNGVELVNGRDFSSNFASDTAAVLLNSTAVKAMNLVNPVGTMVNLHGKMKQVVGVFNDFVWDSPYQSGRPMVVIFDNNKGGNINLRLNTTNNLSKNMELIAQVAKRINPAYPVDVKLVNSLYAQKLQTEKTLGLLSSLFGGLAVLISCMGLFGLVSYSAEQRTKEFGIRRVLGASVGNIMSLLSISFMKMLIAATLISVPLAYYFMNKWLANFEFRTTISLYLILISVIGTSILAFLTVSFQAYKAANTNPVDALKYE